MIVYFQDWHDEEKRSWNAPVAVILSLPSPRNESLLKRFLELIETRRILAISCVGKLARDAEDSIDEYIVENEIDGVITTTHMDEDIEEVCNFLSVHMKIENANSVLVFEGAADDPILDQMEADSRISLVRFDALEH